MEVIPHSDDSMNVSESNSRDETLKEEDIRVRRPPNAFMLFGKEYRKILAKKFEDFSNKEISKILGDEWKKMDTNTKDHYHKLANQVHRQHLEKYPGYYYSPLEARQRKAERKLKSKMSRNAKNNRSTQLDCPVIETFGGNRNFIYQNPMHPLMRPLFNTPIPPRVRFGQPVLRYGPTHPFGGFVRCGGFGFPPPSPSLVIPINAEHSYAAKPQTDRSVKQMIKFEDNYESQPNEVETEAEDKDDIEMMAQSSDIELLANYLPPMHNPNIEVTQVLSHQNQFLPTEQYSNEVNESEAEVTKMSNASVDSELALTEEVKQEVTEEVFGEDIKDQKVVVE